MNKYLMTGIVAAVIVTGITVAGASMFVMSDTNANMQVSQDAKKIVTDVQENIEGIDPGYGQVTQKEGAYAP